MTPNVQNAKSKAVAKQGPTTRLYKNARFKTLFNHAALYPTTRSRRTLDGHWQRLNSRLLHDYIITLLIPAIFSHETHSMPNIQQLHPYTADAGVTTL